MARLFTKHSGDCTVYSALLNGRPEDGICTCGYGWECLHEGDASAMYSPERLAQVKNMSNPQNPADGQHVVIQNGQRMTRTLTQEEAQAEAQRLNQSLQESKGQPVTEDKRATVKRNLCG